jgi:hypothetical protein
MTGQDNALGKKRQAQENTRQNKTTSRQPQAKTRHKTRKPEELDYNEGQQNLGDKTNTRQGKKKGTR